MKRTIQYQLGLVVLLILVVALTACVRPAPGSEGVDVAATATAAAAATIPPLPTQPAGLVLPATPTPLPPVEVPTAVPENLPAPQPTASSAVVLPTTHMVQPGETLATISAIYNVPASEIQAANGITDPNALTVGQILTIPAVGAVTQPQPVPPTGEQVYIVKAGDNLFRIGLNFGFTAAELAAYNGIPDPTLIYVGQQIRIPAR